MPDDILGITISLKDQFSKPLEELIQKVQGVNNSLNQLTKQTQNAFHPNQYKSSIEGFTGVSKSIPPIVESLESSKKSQEQLNKKIMDGITPADQLAHSIINIGKAYLSIHALHEITEIGDELTTLRSRIDIMNDGLQTTEEVTTRIKQIAIQTGTNFFHTGEMVTALGIGAEESFGSTEKLLTATEKLQKMLVIDSTPLAEVNFLMTDIKHAFEEGRLDAQHFRAIEMHLPSFAKILAKELNVSVGELKNMISAGEITSDVMARTLINAQGIDEQFKKMNMTFGRAIQNLKTEAITGLEPALVSITQSLTTIVTLATRIGTYIINQWSLFAPIITTFAAAFIPFLTAVGTAIVYEKALTLATKINTGVNLIGKGVILAKAIATGISNGATLQSIPLIIAATTAQWGFNYAVMSNPITWMVTGIVALIGVLGVVKYAIEKVTGVHISAIGIGKALWSGFTTYISNRFQFIKNQSLIVAGFIKNVFVHPLEATKNLFKNTFQNIINYYGEFINGIISSLNFVISKTNSILGTKLELIPELNLKDSNYKSITGSMKEAYQKHEKSTNGEQYLGVKEETKLLSEIAQNTKNIDEQMLDKDRDKLLQLTEDKAISSFNRSVSHTKNEIQIDIENKNQFQQRSDIETLANEVGQRITKKLIEDMSSYSELP